MEAARDTVPGSECLVGTEFIVGECEALRVLETVGGLAGEADKSSCDKGTTLAFLSRWAEPERCMLRVKSPAHTKEIHNMTWLCRCYIRNRRGRRLCGADPSTRRIRRRC